MDTRTLITAVIFTVLMSIAALCIPLSALAATSVTISSAGDGVFLVQGIGIDGAAAMEINVVYDTTTLANPRVTAGPLIAGAMTANNANSSGMVRMVIIRVTPVKGSGVIATLTFDLRGPSPGKIISLNAKLANSQGAPLPVLVRINNPAEELTSASNPQQGQQSVAETAQTSQFIAPMVIIAGSPEKPAEAKSTADVQGTKTGDERPAPQEQGSEAREAPAATTEIASTAGDAAARIMTKTRTMYAQKSILDRFREFKGKRTSEAFISLFDQDSMFWCRQDPSIALSEGKTAVRARFISSPGKKTSSDVAVMGAKLISLKEDPDNTNTWIAELVPEQGTYEASLAVSQGEGTMVCPLTIAPKVAVGRSRSGTMTKADYERYFSERGTATEAGFDANKDGKRDYIDDYIITANYLAAAKMTQKQK